MMQPVNIDRSTHSSADNALAATVPITTPLESRLEVLNSDQDTANILQAQQNSIRIDLGLNLDTKDEIVMFLRRIQREVDSFIEKFQSWHRKLEVKRETGDEVGILESFDRTRDKFFAKDVDVYLYFVDLLDYRMFARLISYKATADYQEKSLIGKWFAPRDLHSARNREYLIARLHGFNRFSTGWISSEKDYVIQNPEYIEVPGLKEVASTLQRLGYNLALSWLGSTNINLRVVLADRPN